MPEATLQIPEKRREAKGKGEKERYIHVNIKFHRIARRDKKAFLSVQCKEIEENNRKGKTRNLFKKIRDTKGIFHAKLGTIKDRSGMGLTEAEDIKRWHECKEVLQKKIFISAFPLGWPWEVQSSPRVARESWGWRSSHCRA